MIWWAWFVERDRKSVLERKPERVSWYRLCVVPMSDEKVLLPGILLCHITSVCLRSVTFHVLHRNRLIWKRVYNDKFHTPYHHYNYRPSIRNAPSLTVNVYIINVNSYYIRSLSNFENISVNSTRLTETRNIYLHQKGHVSFVNFWRKISENLFQSLRKFPKIC